jgi:hypothetical protein
VMGGHDPGPLALPGPQEGTQADGYPHERQPGPNDAQAGPWGRAADGPPEPNTLPGVPWEPRQPASSRPFLPDRPPIDLGGPPAASHDRDHGAS